LSEEDFSRALKRTDLKVIGLFKEIDYQPNFLSTRISQNNERFIQPYMQTIYIGYYNGPIQFIDGESSGIEVFSLDELKEDIKNDPDKFTEDVKFMIKKYEKLLVPIK